MMHHAVWEALERGSRCTDAPRSAQVEPRQRKPPPRFIAESSNEANQRAGENHDDSGRLCTHEGLAENRPGHITHCYGSYGSWSSSGAGPKMSLGEI
jgi:hypothetical protein